MSYADRTTGFNMEEEFVGSHIDENGFLSFTKQKPQKKLTKEDQIYGIWNQEVEESVFKGSKQLAKTSLAMSFRKSGQIQHDPDTGIKVKYASGKEDAQQKQSVKTSNAASKRDLKTSGLSKKSVCFDESNLKENEVKKHQKKKFQQFGFDKEKDPLQFDGEEDEDDDNEEELLEQQRINQKNKYMKMFSKQNDDDQGQEDNNKFNDNSDNEDDDEDDDDDEDEDGEGFQKSRKNKLFFKSSQNSSKKQEKIKGKSILRKKPQFETSQKGSKGKDYDEDLDDLNDLGSQDEDADNQNAYEDQDEKFKYQKSSLSSQIHLTKDQLRKKKIFNFKRNREDDEEAILEEQTKQFNLPLKFGQQRKQFKKMTDQEIEDESKSVVNFETKEEVQESQFNTKKYGKGFSMLQKMGYKVGKGIGKDEQGIAKPVEAKFKQSFSMYDDYKQMEKDNKKLLNEQFNIDVERDLDEFDNAYNEFKQNQSSFADYDDENTLEFQKTYVSHEQKRFPNRFFAHLNKKSRQAKQGSLTDFSIIPNQTAKIDSSLLSSQNIIGSNTQMKILDMRGGNTITYDKGNGNNFTEFFAANKILDVKSLVDTDTPIFSDMLFNLKNKLDKAKSKMMNLTSKLKIEQDRIITVQYEEKQLIEQSNNHQKIMDQTLTLLNKIQQLRQQSQNLKSAEVLSTFRQLFEGCEQQFIHFNLEQLFVKLITESLSRQFEQLKIEQKRSQNKKQSEIQDEGNQEEEEEIDLGDLQDSGDDEIGESSHQKRRSQKQGFMTELNKLEVKKSVNLIQEAEKLLEKIFLFKQNKNLLQYESELSGNIYLKRDTVLNEKNERLIQRYVQYIINHSFMPHLKNYMIKIFVPTDLKSNNQIIDCLEEYQKILPNSVISDLISSFILPKLNDAVKKWNPVKNEGRDLQGDVDLWLLPWLTIISPIDLLKDTFKLVLAKYSQVLVKWEVKDRSMLEKLKPWKSIISEQQWNDLMLKQIIPKLQFYLDELEINPSDQKDLDIVESIVLWCDFLSDKDICNIMEDTILVKLAEVLMEWLATEDAQKQEIKQWLSNWESLLGKKIMSIESFSNYFATFFEKIDEL